MRGWSDSEEEGKPCVAIGAASLCQKRLLANEREMLRYNKCARSARTEPQLIWGDPTSAPHECMYKSFSSCTDKATKICHLCSAEPLCLRCYQSMPPSLFTCDDCKEEVCRRCLVRNPNTSGGDGLCQSCDCTVQLVGLVFGSVTFSAGDYDEEIFVKLCKAMRHYLPVKDERLSESCEASTHGLVDIPAKSALFENKSMSDADVGLKRLGETLIAVDDVRYTQASIAPTFSDGSPLQKLVDDLKNGLDIMRTPGLRLTVLRWPGRGLYSVDNRRLWCFKQFQEHVRARDGGIVRTSALLCELPISFARLAQEPEVDRMLKHYDGGRNECVRIRHSFP